MINIDDEKERLKNIQEELDNIATQKRNFEAEKHDIKNKGKLNDKDKERLRIIGLEFYRLSTERKYFEKLLFDIRIEIVRKYRKDGIKQGEIADLIGVTKFTIYNWIRRSIEDGTWYVDDEHEPEALIEGDESSKKETEEANPVDNKDYGALKEPEELNLRDNNDDEALKEPEELNPRDNKDDEVSKEQVRKSETIDILSPQEVEVPVQMTDKEILIKYISQRITIPYIAIEMDTTDDKIRRMMKKYDLFKMYYEFHPSEDPFISESRRKKAKKGRIQKGSMTDNDLDCPQLDSPQSHLSPEDEENESKENITAFLTDYLDRLNQRKAAYENLASIIAKESEQEELYHSNGDRRGKRLLDDGDTMGY